MCQKRKLSFNLLNFGSPRTISLFLVLLLGLSPLAALPWRAVSKLELKDQVELKSDPMESLHNSSLVNSNEVSNQVSNPTQLEKNLLKNVDSLLETTSTSQNEVRSDLEQQIYIAGLLSKDNMELTAAYAEKCDDFDLVSLKNNKLEKELYGPKFITEAMGTYNLQTGFGVGASIGIKSGHGAIIKAGATVPLQTVMNPPQLANLDNYTFQTSIGWEW